MNKSTTLSWRADGAADTILHRGLEFLSDTETALLQFNPDFQWEIQIHLTLMQGSNGAARLAPSPMSVGQPA